MASFIVILVGLIEAGAIIGLMYSVIAKHRKAIRNSLSSLQDNLKEKESFVERLSGVFAKLDSLSDLKRKVREFKSGREALKAERGRITITQAELETVEARLRDLEEIERELEASNLETQQESNILKKKEKELTEKNEKLKKQLHESNTQMTNLMNNLEMSAQVREKLNAMQTELLKTEDKISSLLTQVEESNTQYIQLKVRYDALDIEYAQLYEKFADAEAAAGSKKSEEE